MDKDLYWELFRDTGDVAAWLLYRAARRWERDGKTQKTAAGKKGTAAPD